MLRTLAASSLAILLILILGPPLLLDAVIWHDTRRLYNVAMRCTRRVLSVAGIRVHLTGREKIPAGQAVVFMPNHQSNCDPPAVVVNLPPVLIMAKKEFFRVPILGTGMRMHGFVPVERKSRDQAFAAVDRAVESLKEGHSFLVFPEGTRSRDGRLQPFKKGVFVMAIKAGAPIVPISVSGARKIMPKGSFAIRPGTIRIVIHDPIPTAGCEIANREELIAQVRAKIASRLDSSEQPVPK